MLKLTVLKMRIRPGRSLMTLEVAACNGEAKPEVELNLNRDLFESWLPQAIKDSDVMSLFSRLSKIVS